MAPGGLCFSALVAILTGFAAAQSGMPAPYPTAPAGTAYASAGTVKAGTAAIGPTATVGTAPAGTAATGPTATVDAGVLIGTQTTLPSASAAVNKFLGVPFAQPPLGNLRFAPPRALSASNGTGAAVNATQWRSGCMQKISGSPGRKQFTNDVFNIYAPELPPESEDCLYLNVYVPSSPAPADGRTVLFWIYGGGLQLGNAGQPPYDGSNFAAYEDVIVVAPNYRLNVFGFPADESIPRDQVNVGLLDQRAALQWVQDNIKAFGGSPDKVTIFGESAGGLSVDALITSYGPKDKTPFRAGITESGQLDFNIPATFNSTESWNKLAANLSCPVTGALECLRKADAKKIKQVIEDNQLTFQPVADNKTVVSDAIQRRASGNIARVPIMGGTNAQEGRVFVGAIKAGMQGQSLGELLQGGGSAGGLTGGLEGLRRGSSGGGRLGQGLELLKILGAYPIGSPGISNLFDQSSQIVTEGLFQCPALRALNSSAAAGIPTWRYYFDAEFANTQVRPNLGVYHSSEIPLVFSTYPKNNATKDEVSLSQVMRGAWARFAKDPQNGPGWASVAEDQVGVFAIKPTANVTAIPQEKIDYRCPVFDEEYDKLDGSESNAV